MFNKTKVTDNIFGLVGIKPSNDTTLPDVSDENQESRSGRYFTDSPYVNLRWMYETMDVVNSDEEVFNAYLDSLQKEAISDVMDAIITQPAYIDRQVLYQFSNNKIEVEQLPYGFVGYRIEKSLDKNVAFEIIRCLLEFEGEGTIRLALFNTAKKTPIKQSELITISSSLQEVVLNWKIDYSDVFFQGDFYFGYLTQGLTVVPLARKYEFANRMSSIAHLRFTPIEVLTEEATLFDLTKVNASSNCWGLNPDIFVYYDYTDLVIRNERLFAVAIQKQYTINIIQKYIASGRSNRDERIATENLSLMIAQVEGLDGKMEGLIPSLKKDIIRLSQELKALQNGYFVHGFTMIDRS
jgi:hypothetical protein